MKDDEKLTPLRAQRADSAWQEIESTLDAILDRPEDRKELLERCDSAVRKEVSALLDHLASNSDRLGGGLGEYAPAILEDLGDEIQEREWSRQPLGAGDRLGAYRLIEPLGRGGMGVVYLAERDDRQFEKQVAIKLVSAAAADPDAGRRFQNERQLLANLEHPAIARLLDGGVSEQGLPFLVMELVDGLPIDSHCDGHALGLEERLELFLEICSAVEYAHSQLVVHRDLKPANILVTEDGSPKLLDFGIARLLESDGAAGGHTLMHAFTPEYASPEQVRYQHAGVATDVYSLGVILYRLLSGCLPYRTQELSPVQVERLVCDFDPPPPSAAVLDHGEQALWTAELRGDLDNIVGKAMAKSPERRYLTVGALARDVRCHLEHLPVEAMPSSRVYRARKFVLRNRVGAAAAGAVVLSLVAGLGASLWQAARAARERDSARLETAKAETVAELLIELFENADPYGENRSEPTVRELLLRGDAQIRERLNAAPEARADVLAAIARAHAGIGNIERAREVAIEVLAERRRRPSDVEDLVESLTDVGNLEGKLGNSEASQALHREALELQRRAGRLDHVQSSVLYSSLGMAIYRSEPEAGEEYLRQAVAIERREAEEQDALGLARELNNLSLTIEMQGRSEEALALKRVSLGMLERLVGGQHPDVATLTQNIAVTLNGMGRTDEAIALLRKALEIREQRLGGDHPDLLSSYANLGSVLLSEQRVDEAGPLIERAAELAAARPRTFQAVAADINLGSLRREQGRLEEAERLYRAALQRMRELVGSEAAATARVESLLADTLLRRGDLREAEENYLHALETQSVAGARSDRTESRIGLAAALCERSKVAEAEPQLVLARQDLAGLEGQNRVQVAVLSVVSALCAQQSADDEQAKRWLAEAESTLSSFPPKSYWRRRADRLRAELPH